MLGCRRGAPRAARALRAGRLRRSMQPAHVKQCNDFRVSNHPGTCLICNRTCRLYAVRGEAAADPGPRPARRPYAEKYAADQDLFFKEYTAAHLKLSELGVEWETEPFTFEDCLTCAGAQQ
jgi:hypothetical protein